MSAYNMSDVLSDRVFPSQGVYPTYNYCWMYHTAPNFRGAQYLQISLMSFQPRKLRSTKFGVFASFRWCVFIWIRSNRSGTMSLLCYFSTVSTDQTCQTPKESSLETCHCQQFLQQTWRWRAGRLNSSLPRNWRVLCGAFKHLGAQTFQPPWGRSSK